jgi:hypothetical protein
VTSQKLVLMHYKREIVVAQGTETVDQKRRTYKELLKQMNKAGVAGEAVAIHKLGSSNTMLTMEDE